MEISDKQLEKLEQYLTQQMNDLEEQSFLKEVADNPKLQEFITIYNDIDAIDDGTWKLLQEKPTNFESILSQYRSAEVNAFEDKIKDWKRTEVTTASTNKRRLFGYVSIAAAACLAFILYFNLNSSPNLIHLYEDNKDNSSMPALTEKGEDDANSIEVVERLFKQQKFEETILQSEEIISKSSILQPNILIYKGMSHLELDDYEKALSEFDKLTNSEAIDFHKGYWFKLLVYLKQENEAKAIETLHIIVANPSYFNHARAVKILKKIE